MLTAEDAALLGSLSGLAFSLSAFFVGYGIMKANVSELMKHHDRIDETIASLDDKFVSEKQFDATKLYVQDAMKQIQTDIRIIRELLYKPHPTNRKPNSD